MKNSTLKLVRVIILTQAFLQADHLMAQTFAVLHSFAPSFVTNGVAFNADGRMPEDTLTLSGTTLYGTAISGGSGASGTIFAVNTDGGGFTDLHVFTPELNPPYTNSDGASPNAGLLLSGRTLYGTAVYGGPSGWGTVFSLSTDGTGFTNIYSFTGDIDGGYPWAGLALTNNRLYGTTVNGGGSASSAGVVFAVNTDGTGFTNLYSFSGYPVDGQAPYGGLVLSGSTLYGTTTGGGLWNHGTVFAVNTDGTGFTNLYDFTGGTDGAAPYATLTISGHNLYGTTAGGGVNDGGTVFTLDIQGAGLKTLYRFTGGTDGVYPVAELFLSGNTLYGTTAGRNNLGIGSVFAVSTDGTGFTNLYTFKNDGDGAYPSGGPILSRNSLYGTATKGGGSGSGSVFRLSLGPVTAPQMAIIPSTTGLVLSWPTNSGGFSLQSTTNLLSPGSWTTVSTGITAVNGLNTVTNPVSGTQRFYRLMQ